MSAMSLHRPTPMTREEATAVTEQIRAAGERLWFLLLHAHERRAWAALGYSSWQSYVSSEFELSRSRAYQLVTAARVQQAIEDAAGVSTSVDITEAEARDLKPILAEVVTSITDRMAEDPEADAQQVVRDAISDARQTPQPPPFTDSYDGCVRDLERLTARLTRLHCDDAFMDHRGSLGRRHVNAVEDAVRTLETVVQDLRLGRYQS